MDDDIQLPPLPNGVIPGLADWIADVRRAAVRYDRERHAEQAKPATPKAHEAMLSLGENGSWSCYPPSIHRECATIAIRWTDDGRAWIESEQNRELAARLRNTVMQTVLSSFLTNAAAALDGGER